MNKNVKDLIEKAKDVFPGGTQTMSKSFLMFVNDGEFDFPGFAVSGHGCMMECANGKILIDTMGRLGAGILDYDDKDVKKALKEQIDKGLIFSLPSVLEVELADLMKEVVPNCEMMRFCKNGSDATSAAIRLARSCKNKDYILMPKTGYAGFSDQFAVVSARDYGLPKALKEFVEFFEYNDLKDLESKLKTGKFAGIIIEPISLEPAKKGYLQGVRELCDKYDAVLIFDEMVTGFRFALGGCQELFGVNADLMCFGKAMSNGTSIACIAGKKQYIKELENVFFSATYFGNALDIAGAIATIKKLKKLKDKIYPHIWKQGKRFMKAFNNKCKDLGIDAHTIGMAPRINLKFNYENAVLIRDLFHQEMIDRGVFMGIQIYTTWAIKKKHMDQIIKAAEESLEVVKKALDDGDVQKFIKGKGSMQIFKRQ